MVGNRPNNPNTFLKRKVIRNKAKSCYELNQNKNEKENYLGRFIYFGVSKHGNKSSCLYRKNNCLSVCLYVESIQKMCRF